ncbi:MAG: gliding motility-associated C-terminal domain-containing protein [Saprospiraceae bacterium]
MGDSLTLHAVLPPGYPLSLIDTITWTPLDGLTFDNYTIPGLLSPTAKPFKSTEYLVVVTSKDGCEAQDRVLVRVDNEPHIYIPNAFTPDHSNTLNDIFMIFADNKQIQQVDKFQVYDRWGELLFTDSGFMPNDPAHGWDGNYRDKPMTPAVFVYYAEIRLIDGRVLLYKGDVTLVR